MTPDRKLVVNLPDDLHRAFRVRAAEKGIYMSDVVRDLIELWLSGAITLPVEETKESQDK